MARRLNAPAIYQVADTFRQLCLLEGRSLLWPQHKAWTSENLARLRGRFSDVGSQADFLGKWREQLAEDTEDVHRTAADVLSFYLLCPIPAAVAADTKLEHVKEVVSWKLASDPPDYSTIYEAFKTGFAKPGRPYLIYPNIQINFYLAFAQGVQSGRADPRDPESSKRLADSLMKEMKNSKPGRHVLLHLLFPDRFERIVSHTDKEKIVEVFGEFADGAVDLDDAISNIRGHFEQQYGPEVDFYSTPEIRKRWKPKPDKDDEHDETDGTTAHVREKEGVTSAWIFQSNPDYYDIEGALRKLEVQSWKVTSHSNEIKVGDRVYMWKSGSTAGIVAVGEVIDPPRKRQFPAEEEPFVRNRGQMAGDVDRVLIRIVAHVDPILSKKDIAAHPVLRDLTILKIPRKSNYLLKPGEMNAIEELLASQGGTTPAQISLADKVERGLGKGAIWWVNQGQTYRVERREGYIWAPKQTGGRSYEYHLNVAKVQPGDVIFHYANGAVRAVGEVLDWPGEAAAPTETYGTSWGKDGYSVSVKYVDIPEPLLLTTIPIGWRSPAAGAFDKNGSPRQGYLFHLSDEFAAQLAGIIEGRWPNFAWPETLDKTVKIPETTEVDYKEPPFDEIVKRVHEFGFEADARFLRRYHDALKTRGFVILSGVSGTGKTWLTEVYAKAVGGNYLVVPVAPNWTTNEDLLGYLNPVDSAYYDTAFSRLLRRAAEEYTRATARQRRPVPYYVVLDEMNLARVEYYFAKFLSAMETRFRLGSAALELSANETVVLPPNLYVVGTVNIDETTHGFSDKVYDRARLIELEATREAMVARIGNAPHAQVLIEIWDAVHEVAPFAFRVVDEIRAYVDSAISAGRAWEEALDEELLQKILPKLKGADPRLSNALERFSELTQDRLPLSHKKGISMLEGFRRNGFASYF